MITANEGDSDMSISSLITFLTVSLLAILGLASAWFECVQREPRPDTWIHGIPGIGRLLSRIRVLGWIIAFGILGLTTVTFMLSTRDQQELSRKEEIADARLENVDRLTHELEEMSKDQQRTLTSVIDRAVKLQRVADITTERAEAIHDLLNNFFADEMRTQIALASIRNIREGLLPDLSIGVPKSGPIMLN